MIKAHLILMLLPMVALFLSWPTGAGAQKEIVLENEGLRLAFDPASNYGLKALVHKKSGNDLISDKGVGPTILRLDVSTSEGLRRLTQADAQSSSASVSKDGSEATFAYRRVGGLEVNATVSVKISQSANDSTWHIEATSADPSVALQSVRFPFFTGYTGLGESHEDDVFVAPVLYGELYQNPCAAARAAGTIPTPGYFYPGGLGMQFTALYDAKGGFYMACEDPKANIKALLLEVPGRAKDRVTLSYGHFFPEEESQRFANDFPIRLAAFDGDWYDAADIYRTWAAKQKWCERKLEEREGYPEWYKEPIPVFDYRNYPRRPEYEFVPPHECELFTREFIGETRHPYVLFPPGWEKFGPWAGPEFFPPRGGEDSLAKMAANLHERGNYFMHMFCCSIWVHPRDQETELYLKEGAPNRLFMKNGEEYNFDKNLGFLGKTHRMCAGTEGWQATVEKATEECVRRGMDLYQLDLFPISNPVPCYGEGHPHPMGWGRWFGEGWQKLCSRARAAGLKIKPDTIFSAEEMCEIYIPYFDTCLTREERRGKAIYDEEAVQTQTGKAPVFQYVYHDYITAIGDFAEPCSLGDPKAAIAIAKQFTRAKHIGVRIPTKGEEVTKETIRDRQFTYDAVNTLYALGGRRTLFARMLRPPKAEVIIAETRRPVDWRTSQPAIGAFESSDGEITVLISNSSDGDLAVELEAPGEGYRPSELVINGQKSSPAQAGVTPNGGKARIAVGARASMGIVYAPSRPSS